MADNQTHQFNTDHIRDLLSPYLDGEVTQEERALVEQALAASAELQRELELLRRTVALVTALPPIPAPRPFTLTEAAVKTVATPTKSSFGLPGWFKGAAALAAMLPPRSGSTSAGSPSSTAPTGSSTRRGSA